MTAGLCLEARLMKIIARIRCGYTEKFGIPRQSGLVEGLPAQIVFEPEYRIPEAVRGLEGFSHIWLLWQFSESVRKDWSPTVRPPRLGGNKRMGVFATRSPFRPNPIGLSSVRLDRVELTPQLGPVLHVSGADLLDGTPIYDIKPYLPFTDSHPDASAGFSEAVREDRLSVEIAPALLACLPDSLHGPLQALLQADPRPSYQNDPDRVYGMELSGYSIRFTVDGTRLTVAEITKK